MQNRPRLVREQFIKAQEYREKVKKAAGDAAKMPPRDLGMEALVEALDGKRMVHFHTHRHDDIMTAIRLQKEFGFRIVLQHVSEAWKVADEIAKAKVPASIIFIDSPGGKLETVDDWPRTAPALEKAGALTGFHTDDGITDSRWFLRIGRNGCPCRHVARKGSVCTDDGERDNARPRQASRFSRSRQGR